MVWDTSLTPLVYFAFHSKGFAILSTFFSSSHFLYEPWGVHFLFSYSPDQIKQGIWHWCYRDSKQKVFLQYHESSRDTNSKTVSCDILNGDDHHQPTRQKLPDVPNIYIFIDREKEIHTFLSPFTSFYWVNHSQISCELKKYLSLLCNMKPV